MLNRTLWLFTLLTQAWLVALPENIPTQISSGQRIATLVQELSNHQSRFLSDFGTGLRYHATWRSGEREEATDVIGSGEGTVDRLQSRNGKPLSPEEEKKEVERLTSLMADGKVRAANRSAQRFQPYIQQIVHAMPEAMLYVPAPGQPQLRTFASDQVVLDYKPNPAFRPRSLTEGTLKHLSGRIWLDAKSHHLLRMEIRFDDDVNLAGGLLIKLHKGGTVEYEQREIAPGKDAWTHIHLRIRMRELLFKTTSLNAELTASALQLLNPVPDGKNAVAMLLSAPAQD